MSLNELLTLSILEILLGNLDSLLGNHCMNNLEDGMVEGKLYMLDEDNPLDCAVQDFEWCYLLLGSNENSIDICQYQFEVSLGYLTHVSLDPLEETLQS